MIDSSRFPHLDYKKPSFNDKRKPISNIIGLDTEAYTDGSPFLICDSLGNSFDPKAPIPELLNHPDYNNANVMLYNIKYDAGALLRAIPRPLLYELWDRSDIDMSGTRIRYIPHKLLRIRRGKRTISFWDISQFFFSSLDNAAKTYLGEGKMEVPTKRFTRPYVRKNYEMIKEYCIRDAKLTARLGEYLVKKLSEFGIETPALYSCAAISYRYFCDNCRPNDVLRWWEKYPKALQLGMDAYEGGKFEVTARGSFTGHEYDITSAYPYEISRLVDLKNASTRFSTTYESDATYGYIKCRITTHGDVHLPCGVKNASGVRYYPVGSFITTITKNEYDYCLELGCKIEILEAVWLFTKRRNYLYKPVILPLFEIKAAYKGKDKMLYGVTKIVQNSYYGKLCQTIEHHDGTVTAGPAWNPFHASEITANTRIAVTRIQNLLKDRCIAVHTDSVFCLDTLPDDLIKGGLGAFEHVISGEGIMIACGLYQIKDEQHDINKFRGFDTPKSWREMLQERPRATTLRVPGLHVESWVEAMAKNHAVKKINVFRKEMRVQSLNCDTKREWPGKMYAKDFLRDLQFSKPRKKFDI